MKVIILFLLAIHWEVTWSSAISPSEELQIFGGHDINITEAPYMVSILQNSTHYCGGVILSKTIILTSAYCVRCRWNYSVRVGSSIVNKGGKVHQIEKIVRHPNYWIWYYGYDVAVLWLTKPLTFDDSVKPIPMIEKDTKIPEGETTSLTGWGYKNHDDKLSDVLQKVEIPIVSQEKCQKDYTATKFNITNTMLCAGIDEGGKGFCMGDNGGPLVYKGQVVGITSWSSGCARPHHPGVFANVSTLRTWIDEVIASLTMNESRSQENLQ